MKFIKALFKSANFWPLVIVLVAGVLASRTLLFQKGYFNMHDDLQMMRQLEMEKCFMDGQIPCRWVPDMGYKYGFPLFNFYPPLPYLVGHVVRQFGFAFTDTAKILFAMSIIASGVGMYFLAKEFFKRSGGVVAAVFYIWAPYHAVDVYVRGAMNESWALIFFPLIFLFGYKVVTEKANMNKWIISLALSYFGLFTSHNLMIMIFTPFFIVWCLIWIWQNKWKGLLQKVRDLAIAGGLSLGLSAFFTLPAIFENDLTWLKSQLIGYYDYTAHFVTLNQLLITRFWGYGPSIWLENDGMPFQAGHIHWILSIVLVAVLVFNFFKGKNNKKGPSNTILYITGFLFLMGWFASFMTHVRSTPVYILFPFLALVQFPWRFLTLSTFAFSFLAGASVLLLVKFAPKFYKLYAAILCIFVISFNWMYFLPKDGKMGNLTDEEKFSGEAWQLQLTAGIYDYLPLTAKEAPKAPQKVIAEVVDKSTGDIVKDGRTTIDELGQGTDWVKFKTDGPSAVIRINIFEFPNWIITMDGKQINHYVPEVERWGRMWIDVPAGEHQIEAQFTNTPIREISNYVSLVSWLGLATYLMLQFRSGRRNRGRNS